MFIDKLAIFHIFLIFVNFNDILGKSIQQTDVAFQRTYNTNIIQHFWLRFTLAFIFKFSLNRDSIFLK